jgi:hypothetical protein
MTRVLLILAITLPFTAVSRAHADPVTITGGFLFAAGLNVVSPQSTVVGTDGFSIRTNLAISLTEGRIDPLGFCLGESDCAPGRRLGVGGVLDAFDGGLLNTVLTLRGVEYEEVRGFDYSLLLRPEGFFTVPEFGASNTATITAPFTLTGFFSDNLLIEQTFFSGRGTATIRLRRSLNPEHVGWMGSEVRYDFASPNPVPEPATLLLLGTGVTAAWLRRRRTAREHWRGAR